MREYENSFFMLRLAVIKALEHLEAGRLTLAERYLREGLRRAAEDQPGISPGAEQSMAPDVPIQQSAPV